MSPSSIENPNNTIAPYLPLTESAHPSGCPVFGNSVTNDVWKVLQNYFDICRYHRDWWPGPGHQIGVKNGRTTTQTQMDWNFSVSTDSMGFSIHP